MLKYEKCGKYGKSAQLESGNVEKGGNDGTDGNLAKIRKLW